MNKQIEKTIKKALEKAKLTIELAEMMQKSDISKHPEYKKFMKTNHSQGSLASLIVHTEYARLRYIDMKEMIKNKINLIKGK